MPGRRSRTDVLEVRARVFAHGTVRCVHQLFERPVDDGTLRLWVPPLHEIVCFLKRRRAVFGGDDTTLHDGFDPDGDHEFDTAIRSLLEDFGADEHVYDYDDDVLDEVEAEIDEILHDDTPDEDSVWELASMFAISRYSAIWWRSGETHDDDCCCGPVTLLEVLQHLVEPDQRQVALDAHLSVLHQIWDHYWSGDSLIRSNGNSIGGACPRCLTDGFDHLEDLLDEARTAAEDLGEALAAFDTRISLGTDRYRSVREDGEGDVD